MPLYGVIVDTNHTEHTKMSSYLLPEWGFIEDRRSMSPGLRPTYTQSSVFVGLPKLFSSPSMHNGDKYSQQLEELPNQCFNGVRVKENAVKLQETTYASDYIYWRFGKIVLDPLEVQYIKHKLQCIWYLKYIFEFVRKTSHGQMTFSQRFFFYFFIFFIFGTERDRA